MAQHRLEFRASDPLQANLWVKGVNAVVSRFGFQGTRPSREERQHAAVTRGEATATAPLAPAPKVNFYEFAMQRSAEEERPGQDFLSTYGYNLNDLERLELETTAAAAVQSPSYAVLEEMGYTHEQIECARKAIGRRLGVPGSQVNDHSTIWEWLANSLGMDPQAGVTAQYFDPSEGSPG